MIFLHIERNAADFLLLCRKLIFYKIFIKKLSNGLKKIEIYFIIYTSYKK